MKADLRIHGRLVLPADELDVSYARSGGPGGQNVNKVETKVVLAFAIRDSRALSEGQRARLLERLAARLTADGRLVVTASTHRERGRNEEEARARMASLIAEGLRVPKARKATRPTRASKKRRLDAKRQRGDKKRLRGRPGGGDGA